ERTGTTTLNKIGAGTVRVANVQFTNTDGTDASATFGWNVAGGTLQIGANNAMPATAMTLANSAGATLDLNSYNETVTSLGGGGATGGNVALGSGTLTVNGSGAYAGNISGTGALTKTGTGTLNLAGTSNYNGATTVNNGTLQLGIANALPVATALAVGSTAAATFDLNNQPQTVGSLNGGASGAVTLGGGALSITGAATSNFAGTISNSIGTAALIVGGVNPTTLSGNINGDLTLDKYDSGTLTLSGTSTYTRDTNIWAGTVVVQSAAALGNTAAGTYVRGNGGAVLQLANVTGGSVAEPITLYDGALLQNSSGSNGVSGTITVGGGIGRISNTATTGTLLTISGNIVSDDTSGRGLAVGGSGNTTISGNIGGSNDPGGNPTRNITAGLVKNDTGTLTLSGTNSYSGGTTVSDGLLVINRSSALPTGSILTIGANGSVELGDSTLNGNAIPLGTSPSAGTLAPQGVAADGVHAVPEPGTLALLAAAAACGFAIRRKKGLGIRDWGFGDLGI
ncbi:MAG: autotransporter-associated beta strand repeat-containing protein, partial [Thermoguttaceae bacterium]